MSFLTKILTKTVTDVVKGVAKLELAVDDILEKFEDGCPTKPELLKLIQQKNQLQSALQNINSKFTVVNNTVQTTETIVTTVDTAVKVIKVIPVPTSVPPGVGIPINVITILADSLDKLGDLLKGAKGAIKVVPQAASSITSATSTVLTRLQALDVAMNKCIEELDLTPEEVQFVAATAGDNSNLSINVADENNLLARLNPNANTANRYLYQKPGFKNADWLLTIEYNPNNEFTFPQRRIRCTNINDFEGNIYRGVTVFNNGDNNGYSYSNSVKVLVEEAQFVIDNLDDNWWKRNNPDFDWPPLYTDRDGGADTGNQNTNNNQQAPDPPPPPGPPPPPFEFGPNDPEPIEWPQITYVSNPIDSTIQGQIVINEPSQSVTFIVDTGQNTGFQQNNQFGGQFGSGNMGNQYGGGGWGSNNTQYQSGELGVRFDSNLGRIDNEIINVWADRQKVQRTYIYNAPGTYTYKLKITYAQDIIPTAGAKVYFEGYE